MNLIRFTLLLIALHSSTPAWANKVCRAILLQPEIEICEQKDLVLMDLSDDQWNSLVCNADQFELDVHGFRRDPSSYNLISFNELGDCEWEVRANSAR